MRIGIFDMAIPEMLPIDRLLERIARVEADGLDSYWLWHARGRDALGVLGAAGRVVPRIELGTNVVAIQPRHPLALAQQAITAAELAAGRITLGIGLSHQEQIEQRFHLVWEKPVQFASDYLDVLLPVLAGDEADRSAGMVAGSGGVQRIDRHHIPVLLAALGPRMLDLAGRRTEGTTLWMTGPETIRTHVGPRLTEAAGGSARILAAVPLLVTDDRAAAVAQAGEMFARYSTLPSYRAMLDREGWEHAGMAAVVGSEKEVLAELERYRQAGVTDLAAVEYGTDAGEQSRTRDLLIGLAGG